MLVARFTVDNVLGKLVDMRGAENRTPNERRVGSLTRLVEHTRWAVKPETPFFSPAAAKRVLSPMGTQSFSCEQF